MLDGTPDTAAACVDLTADWSAQLDLGPLPLDRVCWAVTEDGEAVEVFYSGEPLFRRPPNLTPVFVRNDGRPARLCADQILGWTCDQDAAEEAAELYRREI